MTAENAEQPGAALGERHAASMRPRPMTAENAGELLADASDKMLQ